jgi:coenzyme F420-reducing hydrogenase gamma subunit
MTQGGDVQMMIRRRSTRLAVLFATAALSAGLAAGPASAQTQSGLINANISDNTVQVPVAVAANICDVDVNVLVQNLVETGQTTCEADADGIATAAGGGGGGGGANQEGLVNINIEDNTVQIPISVAANVCDVSVNVLAQDLSDGSATCGANSFSRANA